MQSRAEIVIAVARPRDAAVAHDVTQRAFAEYARFEHPSSVLGEAVADVRAAIVGGGMLLARIESDVVGVVRHRVVDDSLFFTRLAVLPEARGRGVARALLKRLDALARERGLTSLTLTARSQQPDNRPFWRALGFEITGVSGRYGIADLVTHMRRPVKSR